MSKREIWCIVGWNYIRVTKKDIKYVCLGDWLKCNYNFGCIWREWKGRTKFGEALDSKCAGKPLGQGEEGIKQGSDVIRFLF